MSHNQIRFDFLDSGDWEYLVCTRSHFGSMLDDLPDDSDSQATPVASPYSQHAGPPFVEDADDGWQRKHLPMSFLFL
jgi:hypothetical protein